MVYIQENHQKRNNCVKIKQKTKKNILPPLPLINPSKPPLSPPFPRFLILTEASTDHRPALRCIKAISRLKKQVCYLALYPLKFASFLLLKKSLHFFQFSLVFKKFMVSVNSPFLVLKFSILQYYFRSWVFHIPHFATHFHCVSCMYKWTCANLILT